MKTAISLLLLFSGVSAFATPDGVGKEPSALEITGFTKKAEGKTFVTYMFRDDFKYTISKWAFATRSEAKRFCRYWKGSKLGEVEHSLLIAMSGGANVDDFLKKAIVFNFEPPKHKDRKVSGIMSWMSDTDTEKLVKMGKTDDIFIMYDGRGTSSDTASLRLINQGLKSAGLKPMRIHALCVQEFKKEKDEDKSEESPASAPALAPAEGAK